MLGGLAMKRRWEARRRAEGKPTDKPNLITGPVQICWHKFTRYWDVEHREIPMDKGRLLMTPEEVLRRCDENTIGVVLTGMGKDGVEGARSIKQAGGSVIVQDESSLIFGMPRAVRDAGLADNTVSQFEMAEAITGAVTQCV